MWLEEFENQDYKVKYGSKHGTLEEVKKNYEIQQKANYYARQVRNKKSEIANGNNSDIIKTQLRNAQSKYRIYCQSHGLNVDYSKTWTVGYNGKKNSFKNEKSFITKNGLYKPKIIDSSDTSLKKQIGFYENNGTLTFIPKNSIISNTKIIAGNEVSTKFRSAQKYADMYGGNSDNYSKVVGKIESNKYIFDIHFVKDNKGNEYDFKLKEKTIKGDKNDRKN